MKPASNGVTMLGIVMLFLGVAVVVSFAVWFFSTAG